MIEVETPGGIVEFPDGTPREVITDALRRRFPPGQPNRDFRGESGGRGTGIEAALIGARQGVTLGFGDEINAGVRAGLDFLGGKPLGESYDQRLEHERGLLEQTQQENPVASVVGEIVGAVALPGGAMAKATTLPGALARGAAAGGAFGAAYGAGNAEGGPAARAEGLAEGAAYGALFGAGANAAINVGTRAFRRVFNKAAERPTKEGLKQATTLAYKAVDDAGEVFEPAELQTMAAKAREAIEGSGHYVPEVDAQTRAVLTTLERNSVYPITLSQLDKLRQSAWKRYNAAPNEVGILDAIDAIDDLIVSRESSNELMTAARAAHSKFKKAELLENAFKKAQDQTNSTGSRGNILNKYKQAVTRIINDPKQAKWFSAEETAVMQKLIDGSMTGNVLSRIGKLAPGGNGLMLALNLLGGAHFGPGALAVTAGASAAKAIADRGAMAGADDVLAKVSGAVRPPARPVAVPQGVNALMGLYGAR